MSLSGADGNGPMGGKEADQITMALATQNESTWSSRSTSPSPSPAECVSHLRQPCERGRAAVLARRSAAALPCCTPTPTPTATPLQTPSNTPTRTTPSTGVRAGSGLPPVPAFSPRFSPSCPAAVSTTAKRGDRGPQPASQDLAGPFAGQGAPFSGMNTGERAGKTLAGKAGTASRRPPEQERVQQEKASGTVPSIDSEVTRMFDESGGTLRLVRDGLGDERVPLLSLERLKEMYRTGRGSVRSWRTTAGVVSGGHETPAATGLVEVEQDRLGVFSSNDAYLVQFKEMKPYNSDPEQTLASVVEAGAEGDTKVHLVYLWMGREAGVLACAAARAQGKMLLEQQPPATPTPLLEVEQGCEPALFLALFSYMLPPLAAVVLQGGDETPDLRVLELQESPCLHGSGIVIAVEGPCSASLLAKHGPLPDRSYICLVRPRRRKVGSANDKHSGQRQHGGGRSVGTFDAAYYWHGVGETPAVEKVGILLCQQVDRMFPSPSPSPADRRKRKGAGRKRRLLGGVGSDGGMMRGCVADVKLGLPVPDGFWACVLPERPTSVSALASESRRLLSQDLRPEHRSRPVRVFGVCGGGRKARQSFVWEVTSGGMPSQLRLSPSLSHVVDAGASRVYVWHGNGSSDDGRRAACRVARAYAARVGGGATVEQADAGSEPVGLLDCFIGWNQALVEPPPFLSLSPGRRYSQLESNADVSPLTTPSTTASRCASWSTEGKWSAPRGRHDQRRCGQRLSDDRRASRSASSGSRLTPPGQRTPRLSLASPPPLKNLAGGVMPPPKGCAPAGGSSANSEAFPTPSEQPLATSDSPGRLGATTCVEAIAADRTTDVNRFPASAAEPSSVCASGSSSVIAVERPDDVPSIFDVVLPSLQAAAGEERHDGGSRGSGGDGDGEMYPRSTVQKGAGRQRDGGGGDDDSKREHSGDDQKENDQGKSSRRDEENGELGEQRSSDGPGGGDPSGGAGGGDDGDGAGSRGERGTQKDTGEDEEVEEDDDGDEEVEEGGAKDVEVDTFLRLSDVDFCEGLDVFKNEGKTAVVSTSSEALDSSIGGLSSCGGVDNSHTLSRHLSDFFRSPLSLDLTPQQRPSSILSLSEVQTGARLFGSVKSIGSDDNGAFSFSESGNFSDDLGALCSVIGISEVVTGVDGPRSSTPSAAGGAASPPCTIIAKEIAAHHLLSSPVAPPLPSEEAQDAPIAASDESPVTTKRLGEGVNAGPALAGDTKVGLEVEDSEPERTEAIEEETEQPDGGGGESEEEWLAGDAPNPSDDDNETTGRCTTEPTVVSGDQGSTAHQAAAIPLSHWAGLNEDGSWRTEFARRAAGKAGEVEAERRRLAKIAADESWRSDAGEVDGMGFRGRRDVRRESVVRLQSGNVRDKLNAFEGNAGLNSAKETVDNRSSIGALHGRGLVSAWTKKCTGITPAAATTAQLVPTPSITQEEGRGSPPLSAEGRTRRSPVRTEDSGEQDGEFVWKAGPAPCRLQGRPSLGLIRHGQVRIMTKALLSCPGAGGEETRESGTSHGENVKADASRDGSPSGESSDPPMPRRPPLPPPPPPRAATGTPPPLPARPSPGGVRVTEPRKLPPRPAAAKGNFWLAKAGLTRKKREGVSPASSPPATPPRVFDARDPRGIRNATGAWAKLRHRLEEEEEGQKMSAEGRPESMSPGVAAIVADAPSKARGP